MVDLGLVGEIESINPEILEVLTENQYIPVISPIGVDDKANTLNLNADTVAGEVAGEVGAEKLIILTDVPGILRNSSDPHSLIKNQYKRSFNTHRRWNSARRYVT